MEIFIANKYNGVPQEFDENESFWIPINALLKNENRYAVTYLLQPEFSKEFQSKNISLKFLVDDNHKVLDYSRIY